jgi:hypothetical protein
MGGCQRLREEPYRRSGGPVVDWCGSQGGHLVVRDEAQEVYPEDDSSIQGVEPRRAQRRVTSRGL